MMTVGERIKLIRGGISREEFAAVLGCRWTLVKRYETGEKPLDTNFVEALCREYKVNIQWLFTGEGNQFVHDETADRAHSQTPAIIDEIEGVGLALGILRKLDGLTIGQAQWVLKLAGEWLCGTHRVDCGNPEFIAAVEECRAASGE
jgi:transcriptional regulator with XRE-family HTH domain